MKTNLPVSKLQIQWLGALLLVLIAWMAVSAQPEVLTVSQITNLPPDEPTPDFNNQVVPTRSSQEIALSISVLVFGLAVVIGQIFLLQRRGEPVSESMKYLSVTLVIVGALFLVTAGYGNDQIAPIIGLLGTVAGYLLGRQRSDSPPARS